jgi:chloride channel protein, CIC family
MRRVTGWLLRVDRATRLVILSILLGVVGAAAAQVFLWMLHAAEALLLVPITGYSYLTVAQTHTAQFSLATLAPLWWVPVATTLGGLLAGLLVYRLAPEAEGDGTDAAVKAYHRLDGNIRARIPLVKSLASAITIGSGGVAGREGPTAQIAAGIGSILGRALGLSAEERRLLVVIGMAAGLSAIFKSPLGTAIFGVEVLYSTLAFEGEGLAYTIIAAAVAYALTALLDSATPLFYLPSTFTIQSPFELAWYLALGLAAGAVGALMPTVFYRVRDVFAALPMPPHLKPALGGLLLGVLGIFLPQLLGGGYGWIQLAINAKLPILLMLALAFGKPLALSLTIGSGGSGGTFAPTLYVGAMLGASLAAILHALTSIAPDPAAFAIVGMAATFAGAARVPVASMIIIVEMTGGYTMLMPALLSVAVAFLVQTRLTRHARYPSLVEAQVPHPAQSPAHHSTYYRVLTDLVRQRLLRVDDGMLRAALDDWLDQGASVPLGSEGERIYTADISTGALAAGHSLREIAFPEHLLVVSMLRKGEVIIPGGTTIVEPGDRLLIAATPQALEAARPLLQGPPGAAAPPAAGGDA